MKKRQLLLLSSIVLLLTSCTVGKSKKKQSDIKLETISVSNYKTDFFVGDSFSFGNIVINANYSDKSSKSIDPSKAVFTGFSSETSGDKEITVSYTEEQVTATTKYTVTVKEKSVEKYPVLLTVSNYKERFVVGDSFTPGNINISVTYNDLTTSTIDSNKCSFTGFSSTEGTKTITVSYTENAVTVTANYTVVVDSDVTDLGEKSIAQVLQYVNEHPISVEEGMKGAVDYKTKVTIKGFGLESFSLLKTVAKFGLNFSEPNKIMMGDSTGYMCVASKDGNGTMYDKITGHAGKDTSRYSVTGFLSTYLGHTELLVESFTYNEYLEVSFDSWESSKGVKTIAEYYDIAAINEYNCAGHGYGDVYTINNVTVYAQDSGSGSGRGVFYVGDGSRMLKVISNNRGLLSVGSKYNIVGSLSMLNYGAAMRLLDRTAVASQGDAFNLATAEDLSIDNLRKIQTSQDDTSARFEDYTKKWSKLYKTTGYITTCTQGGNYYIGIRDTYYSGELEISGRGNAQTEYKMALIDNNNFWNVSEEQWMRYCPLRDYVNVDTPCTVYYFMQQLEYYNKKTAWKILLLPETLPEVINE